MGNVVVGRRDGSGSVRRKAAVGQGASGTEAAATSDANSMSSAARGGW